MESTVAAISTGLTEAGISVIRISGPEAISIAQKVFVSCSGKKLSDMNGYTCALGKAVSNKSSIDECIATVFRAPRSYTGEDVVELSCHGGITVTRDILRTVLEAGASPAQAGEFTKRAFLNGKMDLIEAESVMNIINAKSSGEARAALAAKEGHISEEIRMTKFDMLNIAAHLNAWADYPEEDIPEVEPGRIAIEMINCTSRLQQLLNRYDRGKIINSGIDTVIVGKPNVGKSTLMNYLSGLDRSIVTAVPGTTRDTVEEQIAIGDYILNLIDTAGIRDTEDEVEKIGVDRAKKKLENARLVFFVADASKPLDEEDIKIFESIPKNVPTFIFFNKIDLIETDDEDEEYENRRRISDDYSTLTKKHHIFHVTYFEVSLKKNYKSIHHKDVLDFNRLDKYLERFILGKDASYTSDVISYNERQRELIAKAVEINNNAIKALNAGQTLDAVTVLIEESIGCLAELTGENVTDEIVDKVFHNFCVGK